MIITLPSQPQAFPTNAAANLSAHFPQSKDSKVENLASESDALI
jgi:hypothetical protein